MVQPLWDIASLGELASGVPLRPWMTSHMFGSLALDIASWRRSFQLCLGLVDSLGSFIDKCQSIHGDFDGSFNGGNFECGFRLAHESHPRFRFLAGFWFSNVSSCGRERMSLKQETRRDKLYSRGRLCIFDSTLFVKQDQSMPFLCHRADLRITGL